MSMEEDQLTSSPNGRKGGSRMDLAKVSVSSRSKVFQDNWIFRQASHRMLSPAQAHTVSASLEFAKLENHSDSGVRNILRIDCSGIS